MLGKTLIHTLKYFLGLEESHTQTSQKERDALASLAMRANKVLEIGVYEGNATKLLASSMLKTGVLYAVDPFSTGNLGISYGLLITKSQIRRAKKLNNGVTVEVIKDFSYNAASNYSLNNFDLIFIDGDHSIEGIKRDWADWSDRLNQGGFIALHDTRVPDYSPSVAGLGSFQYFESDIKFDLRFKLISQVDSLSILQKL